MAVNFRCRRCGFGVWHREEGPATHVCSQCGESHAIDPAAGLDAEGQLARCFVCDCDRLYRQRDFNRKMGLVVVVIAARGGATSIQGGAILGEPGVREVYFTTLVVQ